MGATNAIVFMWASLPAENTSEVLKLFANALGFFVVISAVTFVMFWIFYKLIVGVGGYIYDRFYRTPTL